MSRDMHGTIDSETKGDMHQQRAVTVWYLKNIHLKNDHTSQHVSKGLNFVHCRVSCESFQLQKECRSIVTRVSQECDELLPGFQSSLAIVFLANRKSVTPIIMRAQPIVLVLCCSNRASICSLALIFLSQTRWIVMTGWCTSISLQPFVQTRLDCGSLLYTSISLHPVFQLCLDCGSLSAHTHQFPVLRFKHVWIMVACLFTLPPAPK